MTFVKQSRYFSSKQTLGVLKEPIQVNQYTELSQESCTDVSRITMDYNIGYNDLIHYLDLSPPLSPQKNSEFSDKYQ